LLRAGGVIRSRLSFCGESENIVTSPRYQQQRCYCHRQECAAGLTQYYESEDLWGKWRALTPREQDVAALACLGFTNREIAARLNIAPDIVKSRLQNVLRQFENANQLQKKIVVTK
jgi:DNA-binding NarL/FixJ family response regulator